jgi:2-methylaconitate cis-trans-isomerase PrpF
MPAAMPITSIPCLLMRGGTSKAACLLAEDLPAGIRMTWTDACWR